MDRRAVFVLDHLELGAVEERAARALVERHLSVQDGALTATELLGDVGLVEPPRGEVPGAVTERDEGGRTGAAPRRRGDSEDRAPHHSHVARPQAMERDQGPSVLVVPGEGVESVADGLESPPVEELGPLRSHPLHVLEGSVQGRRRSAFQAHGHCACVTAPPMV